jgi:hypothetical protein
MANLKLKTPGGGSVSLVSADTASDLTVTVPANTSTLLTTNTTGVCRAWVTYNGNSQTVLASYNVSSVTYRDAGRYTINFTTAMSDSNYAVIGMVSNDSTGTTYIGAIQDYTFSAPTTTACGVLTGYTTGSGLLAGSLQRYTNLAMFAFFR